MRIGGFPGHPSKNDRDFLKPFTVSFFGHRQIDNFRLIEDKLDELIHRLLSEKEYVEFLVSRDGDFDQLVSSAVKRAKRNFRDDNSSLVWVLPYSTAELRMNLKNFRGLVVTFSFVVFHSLKL